MNQLVYELNGLTEDEIRIVEEGELILNSFLIMKYVDVKNISGFIPKLKLLKRIHFQVVDIPVTGDAPKDIIKAYFYKKGELRASKSHTYIAKVGHKHYPIESITEYLLNNLGNYFGMEMAESEIAAIAYPHNTQIRFFSKYFLKQGELLVHGADIYAAYYNDDTIISQIEAQKMEKDLITVQEAIKAILYSFPNNPEILDAYCKLLLFDALIGNNDRHFYNWGCIKSISTN
ncbi:MAG: HipA domain-containing protein [Saprospiraceae bacterium]|nr:HipA domain-containing protein [Saprospiraceae bacterium]